MNQLELALLLKKLHVKGDPRILDRKPEELAHDKCMHSVRIGIEDESSIFIQMAQNESVIVGAASSRSFFEI